jgi:hypothetical protein
MKALILAGGLGTLGFGRYYGIDANQRHPLKASRSWSTRSSSCALTGLVI